MKRLALAAALAIGLTLTACSQPANVASRNPSIAADNFELDRRVIFFNGITDTYLMTIEGRCSIEADGLDGQLEVTCQTGPDEFKKHFLGLSDNVSYFVEQTEPAEVSVYRYRVVFRPSTIIPDAELDTGGS
ncbi:MAG: hypothetical protein GY929_27520 [Actinomycetia bacterium]|nr:hypothetical protein [Actinomycetes bacterium]